jgi:hypothetical protein
VIAREPEAEVPLARDETWWLHPAYRGTQPLPLDAQSGALPHRWVRSDAVPSGSEAIADGASPHTELAQVLYRLNGSRPGPVRGFYVIVCVTEGRYAVGQLCADPEVPLLLFEDLVYTSEASARARAAALRATALLPNRGA